MQLLMHQYLSVEMWWTFEVSDYEYKYTKIGVDIQRSQSSRPSRLEQLEINPERPHLSFSKIRWEGICAPGAK